MSWRNITEPVIMQRQLKVLQRTFHIQRGHGCFYSGKKEFSAEGFVNPAICVCNRKADRRNASLQDPGYATVIGTYLLDLARKDPVMKEVILQPHKTLRRCIEYVHEKAYETALKKAKKEGKAGVGAKYWYCDWLYRGICLGNRLLPVG